MTCGAEASRMLSAGPLGFTHQAAGVTEGRLWRPSVVSSVSLRDESRRTDSSARTRVCVLGFAQSAAGSPPAAIPSGSFKKKRA